MKKKLALLVLGVFLVSGLFGCGNKVPEGTVATVNGEPISQEELDINYNQFYSCMQFYGFDVTQDDVKLEARNTMLDNMITQELLLQEAEKRGLSVSDEEVEEDIQSMVTNQYGGSQADLEEAVQQAGMTMDFFKDAKKEELLLTKLQTELVNNPETVDVIKASHILVDTEEEANEIIAQLDGGADFAALAQEKSTDTGSAANGGELGYFAVNGVTTSKMVDAFSQGAQALEVGEYSKTPVQSEFGYHIILVEDKQSDVNLLEDGEKYQSVLQGIYSYGLQNLAASLEKNADIEILIDTNAVPESPDNTNAGTDNDSNEESKQQ